MKKDSFQERHLFLLEVLVWSIHVCNYTAATSIDFPTGTLTPYCMHVPESAILVAITEISVLESISAGGRNTCLNQMVSFVVSRDRGTH